MKRDAMGLTNMLRGAWRDLTADMFPPQYAVCRRMPRWPYQILRGPYDSFGEASLQLEWMKTITHEATGQEVICPVYFGVLPGPSITPDAHPRMKG
jgi:hypothetical protein